MKKIILGLSSIIFIFAIIIVSCNKSDTIITSNEKVNPNGNLKSSGDFWVNGLEPGILYDFYTKIKSTDFAYKTSLKMENDTLKIAECKIKATDIPEGQNYMPSVGFIGIPNSDISYKENTIEYTYKENEMCEIQIGFSENVGKQDCPGLPNIVNKSHTRKWYCKCQRTGGGAATGVCNIQLTAGNNHSCIECDCKKNNSDNYCSLKMDKIGPSTSEPMFISDYGMLSVKASKFLIVNNF